MRLCVSRQQGIDKTRGRLVGDFPREAASISIIYHKDDTTYRMVLPR
jgi:hypothetical protein